MSVYALIHVAPSCAQYATNRRAASGDVISAMLPAEPALPPVMYGAVRCTRGPGTRPASMASLVLISAYGERPPVVRMVVTPLAR